jgi:glutamate-5-semialdehyde dehydrogenase
MMSSSPQHLNTISDDIRSFVYDMGRDAKAASCILAQVPNDKINVVLCAIASNLKSESASILVANQKDLDAAQEKGLSAAMIDRLTLDDDRIAGIASAIETVAALPDPLDRVLWQNTPEHNKLNIERISVPIGVLGMIYESRPNVTADAAALCLKARNAVILRGGSESLHSSLAIHAIVQATLKDNDLPEACVSMIPISDRDAVGVMLGMHEHIDVMIPRGGKGLTDRVMNEARMPVFGHLDGICHVYVHASANPDLARDVVMNAKMRRTGICGAMETLLLDQNLNPDLARDIVTQLLDAGCEIVGDKMAQGLDARIGAASTVDWETEYLDKKLSIATVANVDEAINHINTYGSHHTDSVLAEDQNIVDQFLKSVDSAIVMHNESTHFADGGEFGMGAEIGIATGKMHARGPVGPEQLTTYKYLVRGTGQTRPV